MNDTELGNFFFIRLVAIPMLPTSSSYVSSTTATQYHRCLHNRHGQVGQLSAKNTYLTSIYIFHISESEITMYRIHHRLGRAV